MKMGRSDFMSVYVLPYNSKEQLSPHLNAQELRCKCGGTHNITVNTDLVAKIEKLISTIATIKGVSADKVHINVSSANRCKAHDIAVGGSGWGMHTLGKAMDFQITCNNQTIDAILIACIAQEIGFTGIGRITSSYIHCDVGTLENHGGMKWLGDEMVKGGISGSIIREPQTYWNYYGLKRSDYFKTETLVEESLEKQLQLILNKMGENLAVDGVIGEKSLATLKKHSINKGDSGEFTKVMQEILNEKGYDCGKADGICGDKTVQAICNAMYDKIFG
jgi:hypothetical protein